MYIKLLSFTLLINLFLYKLTSHNIYLKATLLFYTIQRPHRFDFVNFDHFDKQYRLNQKKEGRSSSKVTKFNCNGHKPDKHSINDPSSRRITEKRRFARN